MSGHGHQHGHGHGHGHAAPDPALLADAAARRAGSRVLWFSLVVLSATALVQVLVATRAGSVALLSDALHNISDAATAVPLLLAFWLAGRAPTTGWTHGYGRAEDLAGLAVVLAIGATCALTVAAAVDRLMSPRAIEAPGAVALAALLGFAGNEVVAQCRIRVGRRIGSAALVADGLHARSDGFVSLAVLLAAGGAAIGWRWVDPAVSLGVALLLGWLLVSATAQVAARLLDRVDPGLVERAHASVVAVPGVAGVRTLRLRWTGHVLRAEVDVLVRPELSVDEGHAVAHRAETALRLGVPLLSVATVHVSPVGAHAD